MQVFLTPSYLGIVTDFADQGELAAQITEQAAHSGCADRAFTEPEARHLFQQLIIAVDFCHRKGISNRDLKVDWRPDFRSCALTDWWLCMRPQTHSSEASLRCTCLAELDLSN